VKTESHLCNNETRILSINDSHMKLVALAALHLLLFHTEYVKYIIKYLNFLSFVINAVCL